MNIKEITAEAIMALDPCDDYSAERVEALVRRLATETPFEVLSSIPFDDARWFIANALPVPERVQWAKACARRAADADFAYWAAAADDADAAYWAARAAARAAAAAYYAGGKDARRTEQHLAIRHGLTLLGGAK